MFGRNTDDNSTEKETTDGVTNASRRSVLQALAGGALVPPAVGQLDEVSASDLIGREGGPVVLMGIDSELGPGDCYHGCPDEHAAMVQTILDDVSNGGDGILLLGGTGGRIIDYWFGDIESRVDEDITHVTGASNIRNQDFEGFSMIAVPSSHGQVSGGLSEAENDALIERRDDVAAFVNNGGGLLGKTQDRLNNDWAYVDQLGEFAAASTGYSDIIVTDEGKDLGLTPTMDGCCYHEVITDFPEEIFDVIILHDAGGAYQGEAAAIGGFEVRLQPEVDLVLDGPDAVEVGSTHTYELELTNVGDELPEDVEFTFTITREGGIEAGDLDLVYQGESIDLTHSEDGALIGRIPETLTVGEDYSETFEIEATFADEGIASRQFTIAAEAVGVGAEEGIYASGDTIVLTSWTVERDAPVRASPVYRDGDIYIGDDDGFLCAFDNQSGEVEWCTEIGGEIQAAPTFRGEYLYVVSTNGHLCRLDVETGAVDWDVDLGAGIYSSPSLVYGMLYVGTDDGHLCALDPETGEVIWEVTLDAGIRSSPTIVDGTLFIGADDGHVCAFDAVTGDFEWTYETGDAVRSSPTYSDETVSGGLVCVGSDDGTLYGLHAEDGSERWTVGTGGAIRSSPTIADGVVFVGSDDGVCYAIGVDSGEIAWEYEDPSGAVRSSPTVAGNLVYFGADDGLVHCVTEDRGLIVWAFDTGSAIGTCSPTLANGNLYIGSSSGAVYGVDAGLDEDTRGRCSRSKLGTIGGHDDPEPRPLFQVEIIGTNASLDDGWLQCEINVENIGDAPATREVELFLKCDDGESVPIDSTEVELDAEEETTVTLESEEVEFPEDVEECVAIVDGEDDEHETEVAVVKCCELKAGQDIPVGEVCIEPEGDTLNIVYRTEDGWELTETHAALGDDLDEYRDEGWLNRAENPAPGQFPYSSDESGTEVTLEASLEDYRTASDDLVVATHAVVRHEDHGTETAWCGKERFTDRGNWATYWTYPVWWRTDDEDGSDEEESEDDDGNGDDSSPGNGGGNGRGNGGGNGRGNGGGNGRGNGGGNGRGNGGGNGR